MSRMSLYRHAADEVGARRAATRAAPTTSVWVALAATLVVLASPPAARAQLGEVQLDWRGFVMTDLRLFADDSLAFERSETTGNVRLEARLDPHIAAVGDVSLVLSERGDGPDTFAALSERARLDPFWIESNALFVELIDVPEGLDIRIGRQAIIWGSADRFHPVSNLNPLDVEDPTVFGAVLPNEMVSLDFRPDWEAGCEDEEPWLSELRLQLVFVPFFKPASPPRSAGLAFTDKRVFRERADTPLTLDLVEKQDVLEANNGWHFAFEPTVSLPERTLDNSMFGARLAGRLFDVDLGLTYFRGFDDFPRAETIVADTTALPEVGVTVGLSYPRVQVLGIDMATSLDFLDGLGLWAEVGITFHDALHRIISTGPQIGINAVERELAEGYFVKAVAGIDYTPVHWLYLNVQYLHGFVDEFGADDLENYLVAGADIKFDNDRFLLRFFNIFNLDDGSYVLYPRFTFKPWQSGELSLGAFLYSSTFTGFDETTKFDSRAAGKSTVFIQARASL